MNSPTTETPISTSDSFQARVQPWVMACFGPEISADRLERSDRFIEEALELVQASDYPRERVYALVDYVYRRDQGDINQEVGGVMVTLAAHCLAFGVDMHEAGETELARIWTKVDQIRAKQQAKPHGSALPVAENPHLPEEYKAKLMDMPADERKRYIEGVFDPAPGVDLTDAYADRMAVRVERDEINKAGRDALHGGAGFVLVTEEGTKHVPREEVLIDKPGRQTSPELAALASKYMNMSDAEFHDRVTGGREAVLADVRRLAASVLSQVNG